MKSRVCLIITLLLLDLSSARADSKYKGEYRPGSEVHADVIESEMNAALSAIHSMNRVESASRSCDPNNNDPSTRDYKCIKRYAELFNKPVIDMRIIWGYKNTDHGMTTDIMTRTALEDELMKPCPRNLVRPENLNACGFRHDQDDADIFYKYIVDPLGREHKFQITMKNSSYSPWEKDNISTYQAAQFAKSTEAREEFLDSLKNADIVFYDGHSRDGGGPDFEPPVKDKNGHTNYAWYRKHQPGLRAMLKALKDRAPGKGPKLIGMFSCSSEQHFLTALHKANPKAGIITSGALAFFQDTPLTLLGGVNAVLGQYCQSDFDKTMNGSHIDRGSAMTLHHFF